MLVSVCVIAYNEQSILPSLIEDIKRQTYSHESLEIVFVDGGSTDETKKIMESFKESDNDFHCIRIFNNPKRTQPSGWNIAIKNAVGEIIVRIDAHTTIPESFIENVVATMDEGECVVGGKRPCLIENDTEWSNILLQTENSLFGSSINSIRRKDTGKDKKYVKTMFHAAYRREVFEKVGGFNENLLRTEDNEFHYRVRRAGYKLRYDSRIYSYQYARNSFKKMVKQKYGNGFWIGLTLSVCPGCISLFHLAPLAFLLAIGLCGALCFWGLWQFIASLAILYFSFGIINTVVAAVTNGHNKFRLLMPILFLILHLSYGVGTFMGILSIPFKRKSLLKGVKKSFSEVSDSVSKNTGKWDETY